MQTDYKKIVQSPPLDYQPLTKATGFQPTASTIGGHGDMSQSAVAAPLF